MQALAANQVDAANVVQDATRRDIAHGDDDQPAESPQRSRGPHAVDHQQKDEDNLDVHVSEGSERAARPDRERHGRHHHQRHRRDPEELRRDADNWQAAAEAPNHHRDERGERRELRKVQRGKRRNRVLWAEEQQRGEQRDAPEAPVRPIDRRQKLDCRIGEGAVSGRRHP
jgi:hypothetical protein